MRRSTVSLALLLLAIYPMSVRAQVKLPVFDDVKEKSKAVVFQDATAPDDYRHGNRLRVTLNGGTQINGILVRTSPNKQQIYVRTQPGSPPRAIALSDIKRVEKGVIKEVGFAGDVTVPEIQELVIYNGAKRTVTYRASTLSSSELSQLGDLEAAENEMARLEFLTGLEERVLKNDIANQREQRKTRELVNQLLVQRLNYDPYEYGVLRAPANAASWVPAGAPIGPAFSLDPWTELALVGLSPSAGPSVLPKLPVVGSDAAPCSAATTRPPKAERYPKTGT